MNPGTHTRAEIFSQPEAWADALEQIEKNRANLKTLLADDYSQIVFTGCGSTYYLAVSAATLFQETTGRPARAVPGSELLLNPEIVLGSGKTLLVPISRSGSTTETVRAVENFKKQKLGPVISISNYGQEPLSGLADVPVVIEKGQEQSIAQTRSFASMFVAATGLALLAGDQQAEFESLRRLPEVGTRLLTKYDPVAQQFGENLDFDRYYFLGSALRYGLACEVNLKMKEMTLTHSEPYHFLEFRHGPMSMVTPSTVVVGLLSEKNFTHEKTVLEEMQARGGNILSLAETEAQVVFESGIAERARGVLYLPVLQLMAFYRSLAKGLIRIAPRFDIRNNP